MKKIIILLILSLFMVTGCSYNEVESKMISVKDVNDIIENFENEENTFIVDVRELDEYEEGHIINSINIPLVLWYAGIISTTSPLTLKVPLFKSKLLLSYNISTSLPNT